MANLAAMLKNAGQFAASESLGQEALQIERRKLGNENPVTIGQMFNLADVLEKLGRDAEAEKLMQETWEHEVKVFGLDHPQTARSSYELAQWAAHRGDREKALTLLQQAVEHGLDAGTKENIASDASLKLLHSDPRFAALVAEAKKGATSGK